MPHGCIYRVTARADARRARSKETACRGVGGRMTWLPYPPHNASLQIECTHGGAPRRDIDHLIVCIDPVAEDLPRQCVAADGVPRCRIVPKHSAVDCVHTHCGLER